jgi:tryptophan synthase alpha chain
MSRIKTAFDRLNAEGRKALIPFITAGDPDAALTLPLMHTLVEAGADVIELGVPFSDPMADGPTIQRASERALAKGMTMRKVLGLVVEFRKTDSKTPVVLMGYANPIEAMGLERFAAAAAQAGVEHMAWIPFPCWRRPPTPSVLPRSPRLPAATSITSRWPVLPAQAHSMLTLWPSACR